MLLKQASIGRHHNEGGSILSNDEPFCPTEWNVILLWVHSRGQYNVTHRTKSFLAGDESIQFLVDYIPYVSEREAAI